MEQNSYSDHGVVVENIARNTLMTLPIEVLVYICSFLSVRDIVKVRCVSSILRQVGETPSLWKTFIWSLYPPHDNELLERVLKMFGEHIKQFHFADVPPSKLEVMLKFCKNVTHLSLPRFTYYGEFGKLKKIMCNMTSLQILDIEVCTNLRIQILFKLATKLKLKELSIYRRSCLSLDGEIPNWIEQWANSKYIPRKLNVIVTDFEKSYRPIDCLKRLCLPAFKNKNLSKVRSLPDIAWFNICFKRSTDFVSVVPYIQVRITDSSVSFPAIRGRRLGLDPVTIEVIPSLARLLHLTRGNYHGKKVHKALVIQGIDGIDEYIDDSDTSLTKSITYIEVSSCLPGLTLMSLSYQNLQRLDLSGNATCLRDLDGLCDLAENCRNLRCLNLKGIDREKVDPLNTSVTVERYHIYNYSHQKLWKILQAMQLTELSLEGWMLSEGIRYNAVEAYPSLQALEVTSASLTDRPSTHRFFDLPLITFCKIDGCISDLHWLEQIFRCRYLRSLFLHFSWNDKDILSIPLEGHCMCLQELYIGCEGAVLAETFISDLCGHGGLEHVALHVRLLTARSITNLIEHSPNLVTFDITLYPMSWTAAQVKDLIARVRKKFFKTKLIDGGLFNVNLSVSSSLSDFNKKDPWIFC